MKNNIMLLALTGAGLMPSQSLQKKMEHEQKLKAEFQANKKAKLKLEEDEEEAHRINGIIDFQNSGSQAETDAIEAGLR